MNLIEPDAAAAVAAGDRLARIGYALCKRLTAKASVICTSPQQPVQPLAIGTGKLLVAMARDGEAEHVAELVRKYTHTDAYLMALERDGAQRHHLDGTPAEAVSDQHRRVARGWLRSRAERRRARTSPPPAPSPSPEPAPAAPDREVVPPPPRRRELPILTLRASTSTSAATRTG